MTKGHKARGTFLGPDCKIAAFAGVAAGRSPKFWLHCGAMLA